MEESTQLLLFFAWVSSAGALIGVIAVSYFLKKMRIIEGLIREGHDPLEIRRAFRETTPHEGLMLWLERSGFRIVKNRDE